MEPKLAAAKEAGFDGIEVFWEDLVYDAKRRDKLENIESNEEAMIKAAEHCKDLCNQHGLSVLVLQPFMNFDGLVDVEKHEGMIAKLKVYIKVAKALGTDMIQVPSQVSLASPFETVDSNSLDEFLWNNGRHPQISSGY